MVLVPLPRAAASAQSSSRASASNSAPSDSGTPASHAIPTPTRDHFLRDGVPSAGFAVQPEDTTEDIFLPEEKDTKKLIWEIAAWVVGAALVAFFIIKVFIEKEQDQPTDGSNGKPHP